MSISNRSLQLGATIKSAREAKGLSKRRLAELAGITHSFVAKIEAGHFQSMGPDILTSLAHALDLPAQDLFALTGYKVPEGLPTFKPYLRARYGSELSENALQALNHLFDAVRDEQAQPAEPADDGSDHEAKLLSGDVRP